MFNFLRGTKKKSDEPTEADAFLQEDATDETAEDGPTIETSLSIPDHWQLNEESRYVYAFYNTQAPYLHENQISIYGMELMWTKQGLEVTGLIRSTVSKSIQFGTTKVLLLDEAQQPIARGAFDLSKLGSVPPYSARPWTFVFTGDNFEVDQETLADNWSLAFELKKRHQLDLAPSWESSIDDKTRKALESIVEEAPALKEGEVNFMGVQAKQKDNGDIAATVLIRNGNDKNIDLQQVPLGIKDASGAEVARGNFKLEDFTVRANTSKPWTFIFPSTMITEGQIDLSSWSAYPIQSQ